MVMQARCPACHAEIRVKPDQSITVCLSCGKVIRIPDDLEVDEQGPGRDEAGGAQTAGEDGGAGADGGFGARPDRAQILVSESHDDSLGRGGEELVSEGPGIEGPGIEGPGIEGHGIEGPGIEGPGIEGPGIEGPGIEGPGIEEPGSRWRGSGVQGEPVGSQGVNAKGAPEEVLDSEDAQTNEIALGTDSVLVGSPVEDEVGEHRGAVEDGAGGGADGPGGQASSELEQEGEDPLERVPTTRFKYAETTRAVDDEELLLDIGGVSRGERQEVSSTSSVIRFETTCPACGTLVGVEGGEVPDFVRCQQCGHEVDVAGQIAEMLGSSGLHDKLSAGQQAELKAWLDGRNAAGDGRAPALGDLSESATRKGQSGHDEEIDVVQTYCPHCKSLVSLDADLLAPGTLCPHCGLPLVATDQVEVENRVAVGFQRSGMLIVWIVVPIVLSMSVVLWLTLADSGMSRADKEWLRPVVRGRMTLSGSVGDQVLVPTTCRSGRAQGYNGVELRVGRSGPSVRLVDSAAGKYVVVTRSRPAESIKLTDCAPFSFEMKRSGIKVGARWLMEGHAELVCRDQSGEIVLRGKVWFQRCP